MLKPSVLEGFHFSGCHKYLCRFILPSESNWIPSASSSILCSRLPSPVSEIVPREFTTRCQGRFSDREHELSTQLTCRDPVGAPARMAICP
jgi:hypothetical protein